MPQDSHGKDENRFLDVILWPPETYTHKINKYNKTYIKVKLGTMTQTTDPSTPEADRSQRMEGQSGLHSEFHGYKVGLKSHTEVKAHWPWRVGDSTAEHTLACVKPRLSPAPNQPTTTSVNLKVGLYDLRWQLIPQSHVKKK